MAHEGVALVDRAGRPGGASDAGQVQFKCKVMPRKKVYEIVGRADPLRDSEQFPWQARLGNKGGKLSLRIIGPAGEDAPTVRAYIDLDQETSAGAEMSGRFA